MKALTLFVTHYPPLCELERVYPEHVLNYHMAFLLNEPDISADTDGTCTLLGTKFWLLCCLDDFILVIENVIYCVC